MNSAEWPRRLFIVGCPRTGSHLLRHMLNQSPYVAIASETHFVPWAKRVGLERRLEAARMGTKWREPAISLLVDQFYGDGAWKWIKRNVSRQDLEARLLDTDLSMRSTFALMMDLYAERRPEELMTSRSGLLVGEKSPSHLYHLQTLLKWFPAAKVLHTFRDPRAIYYSELRSRREGRWGPKARYPWLPASLVDPMLAPAQVAHTTKRWLDAVEVHERYQATLPERYRLVRFEDLVREPESQIEQVCHFLGIPYESMMVENQQVIGSSFESVRLVPAGIAPQVADRWVTGIHPLANAWFQKALGSRMRSFGYTP